MSPEHASLYILALAWLAYFVAHSVFASLTLKRWVAARRPALMPIYRLAFNGFAVLAVVPIVWLLFRHPGPQLWAWDGWAAWFANGLAIAAVAAVFASMRYYDSGEFLGLRQLRAQTRTVEDQEAFHLSPFHRYVRHPWYFFSLIIVWTRDMSAAMLVSALMITAYFILGSMLEERKLIAYHGERYRRYRSRVPGLLPLPWKYLTREQAHEILEREEAAPIAPAGETHRPG
jgi:protein-S-isoprenylcysteine O-methyltransferase Ste14